MYKLLLIVLSGSLGVYGTIANFKNPKTGKVTIHGWAAITGIILTVLVSLSIQSKENEQKQLSTINEKRSQNPIYTMDFIITAEFDSLINDDYPYMVENHKRWYRRALHQEKILRQGYVKNPDGQHYVVFRHSKDSTEFFEYSTFFNPRFTLSFENNKSFDYNTFKVSKSNLAYLLEQKHNNFKVDGSFLNPQGYYNNLNYFYNFNTNKFIVEIRLPKKKKIQDNKQLFSVLDLKNEKMRKNHKIRIIWNLNFPSPDRLKLKIILNNNHLEKPIELQSKSKNNVSINKNETRKQYIFSYYTSGEKRE